MTFFAWKLAQKNSVPQFYLECHLYGWFIKFRRLFLNKLKEILFLFHEQSEQIDALQLAGTLAPMTSSTPLSAAAPRSSQWRWGRPATVPNEEGLPTPCVVNEEALPTFSYPQVLASCTTICSARSSSMVSTITGGNWEGRAPSYQQLPMCRHSKATAGDRWNNGAQKMKWRTVSRSPQGRRWWGACTPKKFVSLLYESLRTPDQLETRTENSVVTLRP